MKKKLCNDSKVTADSLEKNSTTSFGKKFKSTFKNFAEEVRAVRKTKVADFAVVPKNFYRIQTDSHGGFVDLLNIK
jgi:hypothetical protein